MPTASLHSLAIDAEAMTPTPAAPAHTVDIPERQTGRRRARAAQAAAAAGGLASLSAVLVGTPALLLQSQAVRIEH